MHVLVIGGTRFAGLALVWRLLAAGHRVTLLNRGATPDPFGERVTRLVADRKTPDFARVLAGKSFDATVDFFAYHEEDARSAAAVLGQGRTGHYIFISTGQVYLVRENCPRPSSETDYDGPLLTRPSADDAVAQWDYGMGKRQCEDALIEAFRESRFPATRIRIPIVNGERDPQRRLEGYLHRLLDGGPVIVPDGGRHPVRHVYSGEVARAITAMLGDARTFGQAYNLSQEEAPSLADLLAMLAETLGARPAFVSIPAADLGAAGLALTAVSPFSSRWMSMLDPSKARSELGFHHEPLPSYLGKIIASFLAHMPPSPPEGYDNRAAEIQLAHTYKPQGASEP